MKKILLVIALSAMLFTNVNAEDNEEIFMCKNVQINKAFSDFSLVDYNTNNTVVALKSSITKVSKGSYRVWSGMIATRENESAYQSDDGYAKVLIEVDTVNHRYKMIQGNFFNCSGIPKDNFGDNVWTYITPNSMFESLEVYVAKNAKK